VGTSLIRNCPPYMGTSLIRNCLAHRKLPHAYLAHKKMPLGVAGERHCTATRSTLIISLLSMLYTYMQRYGTRVCSAMASLCSRCCKRICSAMVGVPHRPILPPLPTVDRNNEVTSGGVMSRPTARPSIAPARPTTWRFLGPARPKIIMCTSFM
jgi:hypothetical protein